MNEDNTRMQVLFRTGIPLFIIVVVGVLLLWTLTTYEPKDKMERWEESAKGLCESYGLKYDGHDSLGGVSCYYYEDNMHCTRAFCQTTWLGASKYCEESRVLNDGACYNRTHHVDARGTYEFPK